MADPVSLYLGIRIALFVLAVLIGAVVILLSQPAQRATSGEE